MVVAGEEAAGMVVVSDLGEGRVDEREVGQLVLEGRVPVVVVQEALVQAIGRIHYDLV